MSTQKAQASFTACFKTMPRWVNWKRDVLSSDPVSNTLPSLQLPDLTDLLAYYCSHAAVMLSSHQHSVLCINSHQGRKTGACPMDCFVKLYSSALMPCQSLHLYYRVLGYEELWTHGNRKSCDPKESNKQNPSVLWASSQCALWNRTWIATGTSSTEVIL